MNIAGSSRDAFIVTPRRVYKPGEKRLSKHRRRPMSVCHADWQTVRMDSLSTAARTLPTWRQRWARHSATTPAPAATWRRSAEAEAAASGRRCAATVRYSGTPALSRQCSDLAPVAGPRSSPVPPSPLRRRTCPPLLPPASGTVSGSSWLTDSQTPWWIRPRATWIACDRR